MSLPAPSTPAPVDADGPADPVTQVADTAPADAPDATADAEPTEQPDPGCFVDLPPSVVAALAEEGITNPTPVQSAVVPDALAGRDVLGRARTGSGKTLAFGIPVLARLAGARSRPSHPRAVVIVPTRELATQVTRSLLPVAKAVGLRLTTVYGGTPYERQTRQLRQRADVVVATPGRLDDLFEQGYVFFDDVEVTVLDEADHLCDLGFYPAVDRLVGLTPAGSQRLLLSATLDGDVDALVRSHLRDPQVHELDPNAGAIATMTHHTMVVGGFRAKQQATADLVRANGRTIVFTRTREAAVTLVGELEGLGVEAVDLHGDLSQRVRERNLHRFSSGQARAVVATDVAARGIHVDDVDLVVHFDPASDPKAYLHRSGRTARAGKDGCVVTLATPKTTRSVSGLQRAAGVEVLHHDIRTAPRPLTAEALVGAGNPEPPAGAPAKRSGGQGGGGGYRSGKRGGPHRKDRAGDRRGSDRGSYRGDQGGSYRGDKGRGSRGNGAHDGRRHSGSSRPTGR